MILVLALILVAVFVISVFHPLYLISKQYFVILTNECVIHTNLNYLLFSKISIGKGKLRHSTAFRGSSFEMSGMYCTTCATV